MTDVTFSGSELTIGTNHVELPRTIESAVEIDEIVAVLLEPVAGTTVAENVRGFGADGRLLWTIESIPSPSRDSNPYVRIRTENGKLWASDWKGMDYLIDPETGRHLDRTFRK